MSDPLFCRKMRHKNARHPYHPFKESLFDTRTVSMQTYQDETRTPDMLDYMMVTLYIVTSWGNMAGGAGGGGGRGGTG